MVQGGRLVEKERFVQRAEDIMVRLERRDDHPVERERPEEREGGNHRVQPPPACQLPDAGHHTTSVRRASRSMRVATPARTGKRNREMAAPWARSPPWIPLKNVQVESTCVWCTGPARGG